MLLNETNETNETNKYPHDEGVKAAKEGKTIHDNPYKSPNTPKTDDVKSEAWLLVFSNYLWLKIKEPV